MVTGTRPRIVLGSLDESRPDGIVLDETDLLENASVVQHAREEPPLPEVTGQALFSVEVLGISHVDIVESKGERSIISRDADEVDVIPHQTVSPNLNRIAIEAFSKPHKVVLEIGVCLKDALLVVPPLGDLVGVPDDGGAGETGHSDKLPPMDAEGRGGDKDTAGHKSRRPLK